MNAERKSGSETCSNSNQQQREHTGLRTFDAHHSAREVYRACHAPYPGTDVLRAKARQRAQASTERARSDEGPNRNGGGAGAQDRAGESGVSL